MFQRTFLRQDVTANLTLEFTKNRESLAEALKRSLGPLSSSFWMSQKVIVVVSDEIGHVRETTAINLFVGDRLNQQGALAFSKELDGSLTLSPPRLEPGLEKAGIMTVLIGEITRFTDPKILLVQSAGPGVRSYFHKLAQARKFFSSVQDLQTNFDGDDPRTDLRCIPDRLQISDYLQKLAAKGNGFLLPSLSKAKS